MPPPLTRLESQPEDLMGSADVDGASALLEGHMPGKVPGLSAASENPASNGTENHPIVNQQAEILETNGSKSNPGPTEEAKTPASTTEEAKTPALNGGAEHPASNGGLSQPDFPTGTEKPSVIPPIQPGGKKNNKGVPWYDPYPIYCSTTSQPPISYSPQPRVVKLMTLGTTKHPMTLTQSLAISSKIIVRSHQIK